MPKLQSLITTMVLMGSGLTLGDPSAPPGYTSYSWDNGASGQQTQDQTPKKAEKPGTPVSQFFGGTLQTLAADGTLVPVDREKVKDIQYFVLYYSASWCPGCRQFTPELVSFYNTMKATHPNFEIVLIPGDQSEEDMISYMQNDRMPWLAVDFDRASTVISRFGFHSLPSLVFMDSTGRVISSNLNPEDAEYPGRVLRAIQSTLN